VQIGDRSFLPQHHCEESRDLADSCRSKPVPKRTRLCILNSLGIKDFYAEAVLLAIGSWTGQEAGLKLSQFLKGNMPEHIDLRPYLEGPCKEISNYAAVLIAEDDGLGSGTFVKACGFDGILTAHHVLNDVFRFEEFALCLADKPESLRPIRTDSAECVPLGPAPKDAKKDDGPDLAFIILRDAGLLARIREHKKFYCLDSTSLKDFDCKFQGMPWCVAGTNEESKDTSEDHQDGRLTRVANFVAVGTFQSRSVTDEFDYIKLKMTAGEYVFPHNYMGVSGGGIWLIPLLGNQRVGSPILGGVQFHQADPEKHERILTGHGFDSIYSHVRQALNKNERNRIE
jgi:hypothetical protein